MKGGKLEGGGALLAKQQELLEISTFLWRQLHGCSYRGEINKVDEYGLNSSGEGGGKHVLHLPLLDVRFRKPNMHFCRSS